MKKMIALLAATTLVSSGIAFAAKTNNNDVLQTVPDSQNNAKVMADSSSNTSTNDNSGSSTQKSTKAKSKSKSHCKYKNS